jgi:FeS assembly SUF system protein
MSEDPKQEALHHEHGRADTESAGPDPHAALKERIVEVMKSVFDPEIPVNIYELGMVYDIDVDDDANATVTMTLTSPACPVAESLPAEVEVKLNSVEGVKAGKVTLVWEPPWTPDRMSEAAKLQLGMM